TADRDTADRDTADRDTADRDTADPDASGLDGVDPDGDSSGAADPVSVAAGDPPRTVADLVARRERESSDQSQADPD
ncbi:MAG: hypothetical protein L0I76_29505, partial [Pseudonocardia sp.]|nr:hypothetical protein [Pseudonocardia sp.]